MTKSWGYSLLQVDHLSKTKWGEICMYHKKNLTSKRVIKWGELSRCKSTTPSGTFLNSARHSTENPLMFIFILLEVTSNRTSLFTYAGSFFQNKLAQLDGSAQFMWCASPGYEWASPCGAWWKLKKTEIKEQNGEYSTRCFWHKIQMNRETWRGFINNRL